MNYIGLVVVGLIGLVMFFFANKVFIVTGLAVLLYFSGFIQRFTGLSRIPFLKLDTELNLLIIGFVTYFMGFRYGLIFIAVNLLIHFLHVEVFSINSVVDHVLTGFFLVVFVSLFTSLPWNPIVFYGIVGAKIFSVVFRIIVYRSSFLNYWGIRYIFPIVFYLIVLIK